MHTKHITSRAGKRIRIFVSEGDDWQNKPLYQAILEIARCEGVVAAMVMRGIEGFGPEHHLTTDRLPDIADNLPLQIEIIEHAERIEKLLPLLDLMVQRGMMTISPVEIILS